MKRSVIVLMVAALAVPASLFAAEPKIGVVNTQKLMREAPQAASASSALAAEFSTREREVVSMQTLFQARAEELQKNGATMTDLQRGSKERELTVLQRDLTSKQGALEEDFAARRQETLQQLGNLLTLEVQAYGKANNFDLILADGVVFAAGSYDITNAVLEQLKKKANASVVPPAPAAAPATTPAPAPARPPAATPPAAR